MNKFIPVLAAVAVICSACTKEISESDITRQEVQTLSDKLVGGSDGEIIPGGVLVRLDEATTSKIKGGGFAEVSDELFNGLEVTSFTPAIPFKPKNEEVARRVGLHQWFRVKFDEETAPQKAAAKLAASKRVRSVQYGRYTEPVTSPQVYPFEPLPATKVTGEVLFNDPHSIHQWNLHNDGTIAEGAVAGADVGVKDAWRLTGGDRSIIVAVFDCGLNYLHEDLRDAVWINEAEKMDGVDNDGNGFVDDKYGFNFARCYNVGEDYIKGDYKEMAPLTSQKISSDKGSGHGTHVGGIIGATNGNGCGISSVAGGTGNGDGVRLMSCQIFEEGNPDDVQKAMAFIYAADNGACIAQCSYASHSDVITSDAAYEKDWPLEKAAIEYFLAPENSNHEFLKGNIAVFAAGNYGNPYSVYPGALSDVITVTAFGHDFLPGGYSNYGPGCKISAPGGEWKGTENDFSTMILSVGVQNVAQPSPGLQIEYQRSQNYVYMQGTSMACPHVSGVLALGIAYAKKLNKPLTREQITSMLFTSVNDIDQYVTTGTKLYYDMTKDTYSNISLERYYGNMGTGAVDAWKFLMAIEGTPSVVVEAGSSASIDLSDYCNPFDSYDITIDQASIESLGLDSGPVITDGYLQVECGKVGAGKITLSASVGQDSVGGGIGGMDYSREISIVSRQFAAKNGGWL